MNRSKLRENIFKLLYTAEFQEKEEMPQQMSLYFTYSDDNDEDEEVTVSEKDQTYMEEKYHHVTEHIPEIDEMLNRTLIHQDILQFQFPNKQRYKILPAA